MSDGREPRAADAVETGMLPWLPALALADPTGQHPIVHLDPTRRVHADAVVAAARARLGVPFRWEGRQTERLPGLDCLGLVFRAHQDVDGTPWRTFPVDPSLIVASGMLGAPVAGLDGVARSQADPRDLLPGDVAYLLLRDVSIPDAPLWRNEGHDYWPWHTVLATGDGAVIHAAPGAGVREDPLDALPWDALYVTRR